ncbi:nicotinate phosphoribosyltransferase [Liberiplasma polymorphum]|uniref:nicotinate phosphoribosyltransferase n=1 Tax=Liberiplasma polymorphum TaxID=3374570 RepID=UPI00377086CB
MKKINETMLIDFYEFTMANGYFESGFKDQIVYFDLFFRSIPNSGGYAVMAGLKSIVEYVEELSFSDDDIAYLRKRKLFSEGFLTFLKTFEFTGDIYAVKEGTVIFPNEPVISVRATAIEAQLIETYLLLAVNHQSLIATKASRLKYAAKDRLIIEMGARRAHGVSSANLGARAAYIGGADLTSNTYADRHLDIPASGTMAHSWVQLFDSELEAFKAYARIYPNNTTFLVDTYNTLKSGIPNAIKVMKEDLVPKGVNTFAIRIDSGDLTYLSKKARKMLDEAGLPMCKIIASNALDEYLIKALLDQGAPIDVFGVGERLITSKSDPVFGGVYKLVALEEDGVVKPKIKISDNPNKITVPHFKKLYRIYNKDTKKACADVLTIHDEIIDESKPLTLFDPDYTWKKTTYENFTAVNLLIPVFQKGKCVYPLPTVKEVRNYCLEQLNTLWDESRRFEFPHKYYVDLSEKLWQTKMDLIKQHTNNNKL